MLIFVIAIRSLIVLTFVALAVGFAFSAFLFNEGEIVVGMFLGFYMLCGLVFAGPKAIRDWPCNF